MIEFRQLTVSDKVWIDDLLKFSDYRGAEYCFTSLFIWDEAYLSRCARYKDFLVLISGKGENTRYLYPAGRGDKRDVIEALMLDAEERGVEFILIGLSPQARLELEDLFPGKFSFKPSRNSFDYIYESEKLISLAGKRLQPKRNHINRFKETPGWSYEDLTPDKLGEVIAFTEEWCKDVDCGKDQSLCLESAAVYKCLSNFENLNLKGGILRVDGKIVAYTVGEQVNSDTFLVHIEKAFASVRGAYPMINREFAERVASGYKYINREDDAGDEGLRTAKESYCPVFLLEKYTAFVI